MKKVAYFIIGLVGGSLLAAAAIGSRDAQAVSGTLSISGSGHTMTGDLQVSSLLDQASNSFLFDPNATTTAASVAGNLVIGQGKLIRTAYGPLTLDYKSGLDSWATALTVQDTTGRVGIGTTTPSTILDVSGTITATTFNASLERQTNQCSGANCSTTATCTSGKAIVFGFTGDKFLTCDDNFSDCVKGGYCTPGATSCSITEASANNQASVIIWCGKVN